MTTGSQAAGGKPAGMLDHIGITVKDFDKSKAFYLKCLEPLGYGLVMEPFPKAAGFGRAGKPSFWIGEGRPQTWTEGHGVSRSPIHLAFVSPDRASVDAFYLAAIEAGAQDNGKPGLRPIYHPNYYGAFVLDPDGNNIEAVCHAPG